MQAAMMEDFDLALDAKVRHFVEQEARLLDDRDFSSWLEMYTKDCVYWVPVSREQTSPRDGVAHFRDDYQIMLARTHRLLNPRSFSAEPPPVTCHVVSGVRIDEDAGDSLIVSSSQMVIEFRNRGRFEEDQRVFGGRVIHHLARNGSKFAITFKRIDLINADSSFNALAAPF
ncbi:MAG: aromatic-ring-hydroxylating dioxygenase subunit beta [Pseudomonadota bacterium]